MDLAPDGYGSDKLDDSARSSNGFTYPRELERASKDDPPADERTSRSSLERARPRLQPRSAVSTAASLPPIPSVPTPPPIPAATSDHDWFRPQAGSPAEHPLMRGLMLELPPRTGALDKAWLEQWLEAARAALELIYSRSDGPGARG